MLAVGPVGSSDICFFTEYKRKVRQQCPVRRMKLFLIFFFTGFLVTSKSILQSSMSRHALTEGIPCALARALLHR